MRRYVELIFILEADFCDQRAENPSFCCYIRGTRSRNSGSTQKFEEKIPAEDEDAKFETEGVLCGGSATEGVLGGG